MEKVWVSPQVRGDAAMIRLSCKIVSAMPQNDRNRAIIGADAHKINEGPSFARGNSAEFDIVILSKFFESQSPRWACVSRRLQGASATFRQVPP